MAAEHDAPAPVAAAPPVAAPAPPVSLAAVGGAPMGVDSVLSLQRTAGNQAVCRAIASGQILRDDAVPTAGTPLTGVSVTPAISTLPLSAGTTITAAAKPASVSGVTYAVLAGTVSPAAGTTMDASSGALTVDAQQPGGDMKAKATGPANWAEGPFRVVEKPAAIASTTSAAGTDYEGRFTHTFTSAGPSTAGLRGENINEKFDSLTAPSPFGGNFTLQANAAGSAGWTLDASGTMNSTDNVSIGTNIDANPFIKNASNPAPAKSLPQGFTMTQNLHAKSLPADTLDAAPFTTTPHVRTMEEVAGKLKVTLAAGKGSVSVDYKGPPVFRNAKVDKPTVQASPEKPKKGAWQQNTATVSVDSEPAGAAVKFSIAGEALGCTVGSGGVVKIGSIPGTITVRAGGATHYDEVKIQITAPPAAAAGAKPTAEEPETGEAEPLAAPADPADPAAD